MMEKNTIRIVSGIERSGTSMLMQILEGAKVTLVFNKDRKADIHNPKGYYELARGKIISVLEKNPGYVDRFKGKGFVKITAFGLRFLPKGRKYKIIFIERDMGEILNSMEKMKDGDNLKREEIKGPLVKLINYTRSMLDKRDDIEVLYVSYNKIVKNPREEIKKIGEFIGKEFDLDGAVARVDKKLYRNRRVGE